MTGRVEVRDLRPNLNNYKPSAHALREFCVTFCSHRQRLVLKDGPVTWDTLGLQDPGRIPAFTDWSSMLQQVPFVLAMPECAKHGALLDKRLTVLETKKNTPEWACHAVMFGNDFLHEILRTEGSPQDRLANIMQRVRSRGGQVFDKSFQHTSCMEQAGQSLGYATGGPIRMKGVSKQQLQ
eukprot:6052677-Karenia_brevis.AAC.1